MRKSMGGGIVAVGFFFAHVVWLAQDVPVARAADDGGEIVKLKAELEQLKGRLSSQSHAMMDVDYHFANLWFSQVHSDMRQYVLTLSSAAYAQLGQRRFGR
jgi:hypothetical protein